jgi:hypothetical protein
VERVVSVERVIESVAFKKKILEQVFGKLGEIDRRTDAQRSVDNTDVDK